MNTSGWNGALGVEDTVAHHTAIFGLASASGLGTNIGVYGEAKEVTGHGVHGNGAIGVYGTGTVGISGVGVFSGLSTTGVSGTGDTGGYFAGVTRGVQASGSTWAGEFLGHLYVSGSIFEMPNLPSFWSGFYACYDPASDRFSYAVSSKKFKKDIKDLEFDFNKVLELRPVRFKWNELSGAPNRDDIGLIAEEVREIIPELVPHAIKKGTEEEIIGVDYMKIPLFLIKIAAEQKRLIEKLEKRISLLEKGK